MGKFNRGGDSRGGRGFGGDRRGGFGGRGSDRGPVVMHSVICSDCGKNCQVPFRPSGDKPVYCKDCFVRHGGPDRANSGPRPPKAVFGQAMPRVDSFSSNDIKTQLSMINIKLDKLLKAGQIDPTPKKEFVDEMITEKPVKDSVIKDVKTKKVAKTKKPKQTSK